MGGIWQRFLRASQAFMPIGSARRKVLQIIAVVLVFEGISVILLSSYFGAAIGVSSIVAGVAILWLFPLKIKTPPSESTAHEEGRRETYGILFVDHLFRAFGDVYSAIPIGICIIAGVILFNIHFSPRPGFGDFDTLSLMLGILLVAYPYAYRYLKVEISFALLFLFIIVLVLVIPEVIMAISGPNESRVANWYVHYMLAAPMAGLLSLLGVEAASHAEMVSIVFRDGSMNTLSISAACAGLYSFSIFFAAFSSYVLVFQRMPLKATLLVLGLGLLVAYLGNLVRMVVIGLVGYYYGIDALLWTHKHVGWVIFLSWSTVFWYAVIRYEDGRLAKQASKA